MSPPALLKPFSISESQIFMDAILSAFVAFAREGTQPDPEIGEILCKHGLVEKAPVAASTSADGDLLIVSITKKGDEFLKWITENHERPS